MQEFHGMTAKAKGCLQLQHIAVATAHWHEAVVY